MEPFKYRKFFLTEPELVNIPQNKGIRTPNAYIDSERHFHSSANFAMAWRYITEPMLFDQKPHVHPDFDQFLCFLGGNLENMFEFDAEVELYLGREPERHLITSATIVYIPKGMVHSPLTIRKVNKPILFNPITLNPAYYSRYAERRAEFVKQD